MSLERRGFIRSDWQMSKWGRWLQNWPRVIIVLVIWVSMLWCCKEVSLAFGQTTVFLDLAPEGRNHGIILNNVGFYRCERRCLDYPATWEGYGVELRVAPRIRVFYQWGSCGEVCPAGDACSNWVSKRYERGIAWDFATWTWGIGYFIIYNYNIDFWGYYREGGSFFCDENHFVITGGLRIKI